MKRPNSPRPLGRKFDVFLFSPVGEDRNGMSVSVLSTFARRNIDPWRTADEMARQPVDEAAKRLSKMIETIAGGPLSDGPRQLTAIQLIELLSHNGFATPESSRTALPVGNAALATPKLALTLLLIALVWMAVAQGVISVQPSPKANDRATAASEAHITSRAASTIDGRGREQ
jgi:hypothetical protein